ncbi:MAG: DUF2852 domain-containing protein [Paracoccus sp. (in: a-proteobacteria)]|nr:DUF2852 domain-containing protein [Paracoccus sp. (in: a-proteobacteria)]
MHYQTGFFNRINDALIMARDWLDGRGRPGWIAALILSLIFVWPVGLALGVYVFGSRRLSAPENRAESPAFARYRAEVLRDMDDDLRARKAHLARLRAAPDRATFERILAERG